MNRIKFTSKTTLIIKDEFSDTKYKGYEVGSLLPSFAYLYNSKDDKEGVSSWFNYKGLTYIAQQYEYHRRKAK